MRKKIVAASIVFLFALNLYSIVSTATPYPIGNPMIQETYPEYVGVDWQSGLAGKVEMPEIEGSEAFGPIGASSVEQFKSTPPVGTWVYDWYIGAISGDPNIQLRAVVGNAEVWVANDNALKFPEDDSRNDDPTNWQVTDEMVEFIAEEFNTVIYPTDTFYFGAPLDRYGTGTIFEGLGWPSYTYDWIETDNPQRVIIKIFNIQDTNYYDPTYPYYVVGFYSSTYTVNYYNRNMIHIDNWRYWQRLGEEGRQWYPDHPELTVTRPYVYEATIAHEFQHNIHRDWQPAPETWMNEGCSMYAELVCGYGIEANYFNSYFATPDNSLTVWGDQGDINILADYGVAALWTTYLSDHYGGGDLIRTYVQSGITGIEGINAALRTIGYKKWITFDTIYHDWRIANLIRSDQPGHGRYNYKSIDLNDPEIIPVRMYDEIGLPVDWTKGTDYGNTTTILDYDTGVSKIGPYGSDYINFIEWPRRKAKLLTFDGDDTVIYGWTMTNDGWYSGAENLMDALLVGEAYVDPADPTLAITTYWDIEALWDFGFVQVSTDGGATWTSLENEYTTYNYNPAAHPAIVANLPGLTNWSGFIIDEGWLDMTFNLAAYAGETVLIGFRYMTDWATLEEGWYISEAKVSGTSLVLTPIYPEADFQVTIVYLYKVRTRCHCKGYKYKYEYKYIYRVIDMSLKDWKTNANVGFKILPAMQMEQVILIVSPTMEKGFTDYQFAANKVSRSCYSWHDVWDGDGWRVHCWDD